MNREYLQKRGKEIGKERSETRGARSASKASTPRSKALKEENHSYLKRNGETKKSAYGGKQGNWSKVHPLDRK